MLNLSINVQATESKSTKTNRNQRETLMQIWRTHFHNLEKLRIKKF